MHSRKYPLRSFHGPSTSCGGIWLGFPGKKVTINAAAGRATVFHCLPGAVAYRHISMPNRCSDGFVIATHGQVDLPGVGGKVCPCQGRHGIEQKESAVVMR